MFAGDSRAFRRLSHRTKKTEGHTVKTKLLIPLIFFLVLLMGASAMAEKKTIYNGIITRRFSNSTTNVYDAMYVDGKDAQANGKVIKTLNPGAKIEITATHPGWVEIKVGSGVGYVLRHRIDVTGNPSPGVTPDYPITPMAYYAIIDRDVDVKAGMNTDSETLSELTAGARIAIQGFRDGWAVVIHKRVYGYINTNDLSEIYPVASSEEKADGETPISVFSSFYNNNPDRIVNLSRCCELISKELKPGETFNFNNMVSPFSAANGYMLAPVLVDGETKMGYGGGSCQVSSTLWDAVLQLPGVTTLHRSPHGDNAATYLPHGLDAASGTDTQNLILRNDYDFPIRIDASTHDLVLFVAIYKEM